MGFFLDRVDWPCFERLALLNINRHCLDRAGRELARFEPTLHQVNLFAPIELCLVA
jgi:hypothetical protein